MFSFGPPEKEHLMFLLFSRGSKENIEKKVKTFTKCIIHLENYNRAGKRMPKLNNKHCTKMMLSTKDFFSKCE